MTNNEASSGNPWNLPNQITAARLVASVLVFVALAWEHYWIAMVLFLLAASTDWIDGYLARSRGLVTKLGRILDPLADKLLICGTFVYLSSGPGVIAPWMTVVIIAREFVVTVLRSFMEQEGIDFSAKMSGKLKMVLQCVVAVAAMLLLCAMRDAAVPPAWLRWTVQITAWAAVLMTLYSGIVYIFAARRRYPASSAGQT